MLGLTRRSEPTAATALGVAARRYPGVMLASRRVDGGLRRTSYKAVELRSRKLASVLHRIGVGRGDRVATLAWNDDCHLEVVCAASGIGAVCHVLDPDMGPTEFVACLGRAGHAVLFASPDRTPVVAAAAAAANGCLRRVVMLCDADAMPVIRLPPTVGLHCYERLLADEGDWPGADAPAPEAAPDRDAFGLSGADRVLALAPMRDMIAWGLLVAAPMAGAALVLPGRRLDVAGALDICARDEVTVLAAGPDPCAALLRRIADLGAAPPALRRVLCCGGVLPDILRPGFAAFGIAVSWAEDETA